MEWLAGLVGFLAYAAWDFGRKRFERVEQDKYEVVSGKLDTIRGEVIHRLELTESQVRSLDKAFAEYIQSYRRDQDRHKEGQEKLLEAIRHVISKADEKYDVTRTRLKVLEDRLSEVLNWKEFKKNGK